ncbi:MAG: hypothetical protein IKJ65_01190 [Clostridia bacterium]|nr:hypothetical protein [Clostridia bacterium]
MDRCPKCGLGTLVTDSARPIAVIPLRQLILRALFVFLGILVTICVITFLGVRIHYNNESKRIEKKYDNHVVEEIAYDDGTVGHAISFFAEDGDAIYIEELRESFMVVGNVARVEFPDYVWFDIDPSNIESADIKLSPILIRENGEKIKLPAFSMSIAVPEAPIKINSPAQAYNRVVTSIVGIDLNVVYGSQVIINGEDVSDRVDRSGGLSLNLNVYPIGENNISIIVRTDQHKEARRDLVFYRNEMAINLELDPSVGTSSQLAYMTVSGKTEPGAWIEVDTSHDTSSVRINQESGEFSFRARFSVFGDNLVRFRATKEGKPDSEISFYVSYLPAKAEYSRNAWAMDYQQLRLIYEQWHGRVFLCKGRIVDMYYEGETQYSVMNVGKDEEQLIILENQSDVGSLNVGAYYEVYADVAGRLFYKSGYCPHLIARYASIVVNK